MATRVQRKPTVDAWRLIAAGDGEGCLRQPVSDQPDEQAWHEIDRVDDELDGIAEHDVSKYRQKEKGPDRSEPLNE